MSAKSALRGHLYWGRTESPTAVRGDLATPRCWFLELIILGRYVGVCS